MVLTLFIATLSHFQQKETHDPIQQLQRLLSSATSSYPTKNNQACERKI